MISFGSKESCPRGGNSETTGAARMRGSLLLTLLLAPACLSCDLAQLKHDAGRRHYLRGDHQRALALYEQSLAMRQRAHEPPSPAMAACYESIAYVYASQARHAEALHYFHRSLRVRASLPRSDSGKLAVTYENIAYIHAEQGKPLHAMLYLLRAAVVSQPSKQPPDRETDAC